MEFKNIVICIDGTNNDPDMAKETDSDTTNVHRLSELLTKDETQIVKYFKGVGTIKVENIVDKLLDLKGEITGFGADRIRKKAQYFIESNYNHGDKVFIFGFSRGAAIARDLTNHLNNIPIQFLGLWDTVGAFGISIDILGLPTQQQNFGKVLDIPDNVLSTYHLLAIDEERNAFIPTLIEESEKVVEVWFSGVHADIGGGYDNRKLADITLKFMIEQSNKILRFNQKKIKSFFENVDWNGGEIHDNKESIPAKFGGLSLREIVVRKNNKISKTKPIIHKSVISRMEQKDYNPKNLHRIDSYQIMG